MHIGFDNTCRIACNDDRRLINRVRNDRAGTYDGIIRQVNTLENKCA